jgi:hypothetical protein
MHGRAGPRDGSHRPIRLEMVGLFPELFSVCVSRCMTGQLARAGASADRDQLGDYPPDVLAMHNAAGELFAALVAEFGGRVAVVATGTASPRGLWLSMRHRLPSSGVAVFLEGRLLDVPLEDVPAIRRAVAAELAARRGHGAAA